MGGEEREGDRGWLLVHYKSGMMELAVTEMFVCMVRLFFLLAFCLNFSRLSVSCFDILSFCFFHTAVATNGVGSFPGFCYFWGLMFSDCAARYLDEAEYKVISTPSYIDRRRERTCVLVALFSFPLSASNKVPERWD